MSTPISVSGGGMLDKAGSSPLISVKDLAVSFPSEAEPGPPTWVGVWRN